MIRFGFCFFAAEFPRLALMTRHERRFRHFRKFFYSDATWATVFSPVFRRAALFIPRAGLAGVHPFASPGSSSLPRSLRRLLGLCVNEHRFRRADFDASAPDFDTQSATGLLPVPSSFTPQELPFPSPTGHSRVSRQSDREFSCRWASDGL
jgi:hypothetical protein